MCLFVTSFIHLSNRNEHGSERRRWFGNRQNRWPTYRSSSAAVNNSTTRRASSSPQIAVLATATTGGGGGGGGQSCSVTSAVGGGGGGGGSSAPSVRGHEACLLPCHGPCAASNQSSSASCRGFNRNQDRRSSASSATELGGNNYSAAAHEAHVALARRTPHRVLISETNTLARTTH